MGMYDEVVCFHPLPEYPAGRPQTKRFQTKNFENGLNLYLIAPDGKVWLVAKAVGDDDELPCFMRVEPRTMTMRDFWGGDRLEYLITFDSAGRVDKIKRIRSESKTSTGG